MKANILLRYENKWVALNSNRNKVLHAATTIDQLNKVLAKTREKDVILHYVMPFNGTIYLAYPNNLNSSLVHSVKVGSNHI